MAPGPVHIRFAARAGMTMKSASIPRCRGWMRPGRPCSGGGRAHPDSRRKSFTAALKSLPRHARSIILGGDGFDAVPIGLRARTKRVRYRAHGVRRRERTWYTRELLTEPTGRWRHTLTSSVMPPRRNATVAGIGCSRGDHILTATFQRTAGGGPRRSRTPAPRRPSRRMPARCTSAG